MAQYYDRGYFLSDCSVTSSLNLFHHPPLHLNGVGGKFCCNVPEYVVVVTETVAFHYVIVSALLS